MRDIYIDRELCIFLVLILNIVSHLLTLNWSKHFIRWGCFQICSENNDASLLLYACEVIHLINKGVISPYVQVQGGILLIILSVFIM